MDSVNVTDNVWGEEGEAGNSSERPEVYIFHQTAVKVPLLLLYTLVFILAFFGKYKVPPFPGTYLPPSLTWRREVLMEWLSGLCRATLQQVWLSWLNFYILRS